MCNLYSLTKGQQAMREAARAMRDVTGNLPSFPGIFPDYAAPIVRNAPDGVRELSTAPRALRSPPGLTASVDVWVAVRALSPPDK
jgi:hypothetical protein